MADFSTSSHKERWFFTAEELATKYLIANQRASRILEKCGSTAIEFDCERGLLLYPEQPINQKKTGSKKNVSLADPLTTGDESFMRVFYENKVIDVCKALQLPQTIKTAAITYFKRFYISWSIMEHHPKYVMLTCIYIACKSLDNYIDIELFVNQFNVDSKVILGIEMLVLKSLKLDIIVYGPYRSIDLLVGDIKKYVHGDFSTAKLKEVQESVEHEIDRLMLTDAPFIFPPGQLALAALRNVIENLKLFDFERYLQSICQQQQQNDQFASKLLSTLKEINILVERLKFPSIEEMKPIDKKLTQCRKDRIYVRAKRKVDKLPK